MHFSRACAFLFAYVEFISYLCSLKCIRMPKCQSSVGFPVWQAFCRLIINDYLFIEHYKPKNMTEVSNEQIVNAIVEGIQNRKGHKIVTVDLTALPEAPCSYFVIAEGHSSTQVCAIADEVEDFVRKSLRVKPFVVDGVENAEWIAMDYGQIIVHIFQREPRAFYDIEHLWEDGKLKEIPDLD